MSAAWTPVEPDCAAGGERVDSVEAILSRIAGPDQGRRPIVVVPSLHAVVDRQAQGETSPGIDAVTAPYVEKACGSPADEGEEFSEVCAAFGENPRGLPGFIREALAAKCSTAAEMKRQTEGRDRR